MAAEVPQFGTPMSTINVIGFAPDATARELKNLLRFLQGYQGAHVTPGRGAPCLFAKFESVEEAAAAIQVINGQQWDMDNPAPHTILKADFARREMEVREAVAQQGVPGNWAAAQSVARQMAGPPANDYAFQQPQQQAWKKPRPAGWNQQQGFQQQGFVAPQMAPQMVSPAQAHNPSHPAPDGAGKDTITIMGLKEKGIHNPEQMHQWFSQIPGFMALHVNERIGALFIKFSSHEEAEVGLATANEHEFGAEWARRNLDI